MIYCYSSRDYDRLTQLLMPVPKHLMDRLFSRGLSIYVLPDSHEGYMRLYRTLRRNLETYPPDTRLPHQSAHYHIASKQLVLFRHHLYSTYNVVLHELGHAMDFLYSDTAVPFSSNGWVHSKLAKTGHLNWYTKKKDDYSGILCEHFATCFAAFFSEEEAEDSYGHHHIGQLHRETINLFMYYIYNIDKDKTYA